jgi:hypothetical protein
MPLYVGETQLSWGLNKDEYNDTPDAYLESQRQATRGTGPPAKYINVDGPVAGSAEKAVKLGLRLASTVRKTGDGYELSYEVTNVVEGQEMAFALPQAPSTKGLRVVWESAFSRKLVDYVARIGLTSLVPQKRTVISFLAGEITERSNLLKIFQGDTLIFSTTAPAYVPLDE